MYLMVICKVINTHHHDDHINGNQAFVEAEIIAHENAGKRMKEDYEYIEGYLNNRRKRNIRMRALAETLKNDPGKIMQITKWIYPFEMIVENYDSVFRLTLQTITFSDGLVLDMGDMKIELYYFGPGFHSDNDIIVSISEENIVFTGDLIRKTDQYAFLHSDSRFDPWISSLEKIRRNNKNIKHVVTIQYGILSGKVISDFHLKLRNMREEWQNRSNAADVLQTMIAEFGFQEAVLNFEKRFILNKSNSHFLWGGDLFEIVEEYRKKKM